MDPLAIVLVILGGLIMLVGGVMLLVAAFRESVWWGVAYLLVPFAALVFVIMHWSAAKRGFVLNILGVCVAFGGVFVSPTVRKTVAGGVPAGVNLPLLEKEKSSDLNAQIEARRAEVDQLEAQFNAQGAVLTQQYQALDARRKALKADDAAAVEAFNAEAAAYQQANGALKQLRQKADDAQRELTSLLDERSRRQAIGGKTGGRNTQTVSVGQSDSRRVIPARATSGPVVIFTTAGCVWCTRAKQYFARKGVRYEERDIERSPEAQAEFRRLGGRGVPLIIVGSERISGFDQKRLDQLL